MAHPRNFTHEQRAFLKENCMQMCPDDVVTAFNERFDDRRISYAGVTAWKCRNGIRFKGSTRDPRWTAEELEWCRERVKDFDGLDECTYDFLEAFPGTKCTHGMVKGWFRNHRPSTGIDGRFRSGNVPYNWHPVGTEKVLLGGDVYVKLRDPLPTDTNSHAGWMQKSRLVWEQANGRKVPEGHVVRFADHDNRNFDPGNLVCMPRDVSGAISSMKLQYHDRETLELAMDVAMLTMEAKRKCEKAGMNWRAVRRLAND